MWVATQDLPRSAAHPFYARLNQIFEKADFDGYVEALCQRFYADAIGRPSLAPGRDFRLLLIGYFEGLDAERAITWRAADSLALREFLGLVLPEAPPDHSTISRTRRLIDLETHEAVFTWILQQLADAGLVKGKTIGIDATTLRGNPSHLATSFANIEFDVLRALAIEHVGQLLIGHGQGLGDIGAGLQGREGRPRFVGGLRQQHRCDCAGQLVS